jgi:hypothetical protein
VPEHRGAPLVTGVLAEVGPERVDAAGVAALRDNDDGRVLPSSAVLTAVSYPMVKSVPDRSLSIVPGTPTTGIACWRSSASAPVKVPLPPMATRPSIPAARRFAAAASRPASVWNAGQRGVQDRPAALQDVADVLAAERDEVGVEHAGVAVPYPDDLDIRPAGSAHHRADRGVHARRVTTAGEHSDAGQSGHPRAPRHDMDGLIALAGLSHCRQSTDAARIRL